jgi:hypothetical protein
MDGRDEGRLIDGPGAGPPEGPGGAAQARLPRILPSTVCPTATGFVAQLDFLTAFSPVRMGALLIYEGH